MICHEVQAFHNLFIPSHGIEVDNERREPQGYPDSNDLEVANKHVPEGRRFSPHGSWTDREINEQAYDDACCYGIEGLLVVVTCKQGWVLESSVGWTESVPSP